MLCWLNAESGISWWTFFRWFFKVFRAQKHSLLLDFLCVLAYIRREDEFQVFETRNDENRHADSHVCGSAVAVHMFLNVKLWMSAWLIKCFCDYVVEVALWLQFWKCLSRCHSRSGNPLYIQLVDFLVVHVCAFWVVWKKCTCRTLSRIIQRLLFLSQLKKDGACSDRKIGGRLC